MIIAKRFKINRKIRDFFLEIYEGHDLDKQCDILLIKIDGPADKDIRQTAHFPEEPPHDPRLNGIITPYQIAENNKEYFAVLALQKGTMLKKNIEIMNQLDKPFHESEIIRIGRILCKLTTKAESNNLIPLISSDLVIIAVDSVPSIIAIAPNYLSETTAANITPPQRTIAILLNEMADAGRKETSCATKQTDSKISPNLKKVLQLAASEDSHLGNVNEFSRILTRQVTDRRYLKSFILLCFGILTIIAAIVLSRTYNRVEIFKQDSAIERIKLAAEESQAKAYETAKKSKVLIASQRINTPQQAIDAEYLLSRGDKYLAAMEFDQAQSTYLQAIVLSEAAIKLENETVKLRIEAQEARELARLSQSRWFPLFGSAYIQLPDQIARAGDTALEGESQYIKERYREAAVAYNLAAEFYDSVPPNEYNELLYRHRALTAQHRATLAENSWEKLRAAINLISSASANKAKKQMAIGKGLLQSGENAEAASNFNKAGELFETATKTAIEEMGAKAASAIAYEKAIEAAKLWQTKFRAMQKDTEPAEIAGAKKSLEKAHKLASQKNYKQASLSYESAAAQYELQIQQLDTEAEILVNRYAIQAKQLIKTLDESQKNLENRLTGARNKFESIQAQISQHHESEQYKQLLKDSIATRKRYSHITKLSRYSNANVYSGEANEEARSMLAKSMDLITEGQYIEASVGLKNAVDNLTQLVDLPDAFETFFSKEEHALESMETSMQVIGPVARELPEVKKLLDLGNKSISDANELMRTRELTDAARSLEDAKLAFDSLIPQAEIELMNHALNADSELRTEVALSALNELLVLNPEHLQARKLMKKIQSIERPQKRITIVQGTIRNDGRMIPSSLTEQALTGIIGDPSRIRANHMGLLFDELGIIATPDPETGKILSIVVYYAKPLYENEPKKFYPGIIEIEGVPIGRDDSIEQINRSLKHIQFEPTQVGNTYKATYMGLRILINYIKRSNQIYSISMLFLPNPNFIPH